MTERVYRISQARFDPFGVITRAQSAGLDANTMARISSGGFDLLIWLASVRPTENRPTDLARLGVITVRFGDRPEAIPFWREVADEATLSSSAVIWHRELFTTGKPVRRLEATTVQGLYVTENAREPLTATIRTIAAFCLDLQANSPWLLERLAKV
jgi:hypothetical protein